MGPDADLIILLQVGVSANTRENLQPADEKRERRSRCRDFRTDNESALENYNTVLPLLPLLPLLLLVLNMDKVLSVP